MLKVENIYKTFKDFWGRKKKVLKDICFTAKEEEIVGLIGPNGAGKTTTFKICTGLLKPDKGRVHFEEGNIKGMKEKIGFLPELPYFYENLTGYEYLKFILRIYGKKYKNENSLIEQICEKFNINDTIKKPIRTFSRGQKQKIGIASVFIHNPLILILDEPLSGLDPISRKEIKEVLGEEKKKGKTILFSSHILSDAEEICDRIVMIHKGSIIKEGNLDEIIPTGKKTIKILFQYKGNVEEIFKEHLKTEEGYCVKVKETEIHNTCEKIIRHGKGKILKITPEFPTLEEVFYEILKNADNSNIN